MKLLVYKNDKLYNRYDLTGSYIEDKKEKYEELAMIETIKKKRPKTLLETELTNIKAQFENNFKIVWE